MKIYTRARIGLFVWLLGFGILSSCVHTRRGLGIDNQEHAVNVVNSSSAGYDCKTIFKNFVGFMAPVLVTLSWVLLSGLVAGSAINSVEGQFPAGGPCHSYEESARYCSDWCKGYGQLPAESTSNSASKLHVSPFNWFAI
ncbi:hypothetical protein [Cardinium endosymbiont of Sogatella furcifera]|uniref:hypothetical protein n=1 Tax=Cardinium endosymbiont of Sogatella furcifera TaxID=650378 RepID=UPI000E0CD0BF|nr:hypothetical protein [Cardinium endosymbiont of Sogatella furcifera]